jgi:hypothetical protein
MSLAMYAAPFNESNDDKNNDTIINKKRQQTHNKTQKRYTKENFDTEKVNSVLQTIHQNSKVEDDNETLGEFNPPPKPESSGVQKTLATEQMINMSNLNNQAMLGKAPDPNYDYNPDMDLELNNVQANYGDQKTIEEYYKKFIPNYQAMKTNNRNVNKQYYPNSSMNSNLDPANISMNPQQDLLMQKLNYMIHLLEEQQDERTNNVTEEVVLYSFLGIFIIFIVDSFARVGKYVR